MKGDFYIFNIYLYYTKGGIFMKKSSKKLMGLLMVFVLFTGEENFKHNIYIISTYERRFLHF